MNIITFFRKYGYLKALGLVVASSVIMILSLIIAKSSGVPKVPYGQSIVTAAKLGIGFVLLFLLCRAKTSWFLNNWKFNGKQILAIVILFLPFVAFIPINKYAYSGNLLQYVSNILHALSTGFVEEIMYRGVFLVAFFWLYAKSNSKNPMVAAVIFTGLFFGYFHLVNLAMGAPPMVVFWQCNASALIGFGFALFTILTRNVWLPVLSHSLYNSVGFHNLSEGFLGFDLDTSFSILRFGVPIVLTVVFALLYERSTGQNWVFKTKRAFWRFLKCFVTVVALNR